MQSKKRGISGRLYLVITALLWSVNGFLIKSVTWSGLNVAIVRGMVGALVILFILRKRLPIRFTPRKVATAVCHCMQGLLYVISIKYTTAANAVVLQNTSLLYIVLVTAIVTRTKPRRRDLIACFAMLGGIVLTAAGNMGGGGMIGNGLAMISAMFYAGVFFFGSGLGEESEDAVLIGYFLFYLLSPLLIGSPDLVNAVPMDWVLVVLDGILISFAWLLFAKGIKTTPALEANFITLLEPVLSPVWTFLFLQEKMTVTSLLGCAVVILTLIVYNARQAKPDI